MAKEYTVSADNLKKLDAYFQIEQAKVGDGNYVTLTVVQIAEGSNLALATAHRGIKELERRGVLKVIKPPTRRETVQYIYKGNVQRSRQELEDTIISLENEVKQLKEKLTEYEKSFTKVQVINVDETLQITIKRA